MSEKIEAIKDYLYQIAGKTWMIPEVRLEKSESGRVVIPGSEITRMNCHVANGICGVHSSLTGAELDFLCDITSTKYTTVADEIGVSKSVISKWTAKSESEIPLAPSVVLKKWFWGRIFGEDTALAIPAGVLCNDRKLLPFLKGIGDGFEVRKAG